MFVGSECGNGKGIPRKSRMWSRWSSCGTQTRGKKNADREIGNAKRAGRKYENKGPLGNKIRKGETRQLEKEHRTEEGNGRRRKMGALHHFSASAVAREGPCEGARGCLLMVARVGLSKIESREAKVLKVIGFAERKY